MGQVRRFAMLIRSRETHDDLDRGIAVSLRWSFQPVRGGKSDRQLGSGPTRVGELDGTKLMGIKARELGLDAFLSVPESWPYTSAGLWLVRNLG